ncbi:MAG: MFS transporter [Bryobacteraceae bacterium]
MPTTQAAARTKLSGAQWGVLSLLVLSVFINYVDRGNLSIAGPLLMASPEKGGLGLDPARLGSLLAAFFWTYALCQLFGIVGILLDRFDVCWVYAAAFLAWSAATAATGLVGSFGTLFVLRLLLGMGESAAYPSYSKIFAVHFPEHHRGLANALIDAGSKFGPALGTLLGGLLMARFGWRPFFFVLGAASLTWLIPWLKWMPRGKGSVVSHVQNAPSTLQILEQRSVWGSFAGLFCGNYFWYFLLTWLPSYMVMERHFSMDRMATMGSLAFLAIGISSGLCGWISDHWIASGATPTRVRKTFAVGGLTLSTIILPVAMVNSQTLSMTLLFLTCIFFGMWSSNHWALIQTMAGPRAAGKWTGLQNGVGNLAGVAAPALTGWVVARTGQFYWAFAVATGFVLAGAFCYMFVIGPIREVDWDHHSDGRLGLSLAAGIAGFLAGGATGFLLRPSAAIGQLPLVTVLSRGGNLQPADAVMIPVAQQSFNITVIAALVGAALAILIARRAVRRAIV